MPVLYMMVGLPGSGKSYFAESIQGVVVHSSDAIREELLGDVDDQSRNWMVFDVLHSRAIQDLNAGKNVVYDATNIYCGRRVNFLQMLERRGVRSEKVCVYMRTPFATCVKNNAERDRHVPLPVLRRMNKELETPKMTEGWDSILVVDWGKPSRPPYFNLGGVFG